MNSPEIGKLEGIIKAKESEVAKFGAKHVSQNGEIAALKACLVLIRAVKYAKISMDSSYERRLNAGKSLTEARAILGRLP